MAFAVQIANSCKRRPTHIRASLAGTQIIGALALLRVSSPRSRLIDRRSQHPIHCHRHWLNEHYRRYAIVDRRDGSAALVDPCWDIAGIYHHVLEELGAKRISAAVCVPSQRVDTAAARCF